LKGRFVISTTDFKRYSTKFLRNGEPWMVIEYQHVKPGKGGAFVRTKLKNLISGRILEETFRSGEKFEEADIASKKMQYLYADEHYHFMDQDTFDQIAFDENQIESTKKYLLEETVYNVMLFEGKPISVEPPMFMELKITETIPGVKGDTAQGGNKPATLETGLVVQVPLFLNEEDYVKVDTRDGKYIERVDK
jgi:elongation factor P